jgi:hypothetical protein
LRTRIATSSCCALLLLLAAAGCEPEETCGEACRDRYLAFGVLDSVGFLYNQNLAGQPTGGQDLQVDCSLGGTAHVTGSTAVDPGSEINTLDLRFDLAGCRHAGGGYRLGFTGVVDWKGTFRPAGFTAMTTTAEGLEFEGTVSESPAVDVGDTCDVHLLVQGDDFEEAEVDGEICGREVSY